MGTMTFEAVVPAPIGVVWDYHQDVRKALPELSVPGDEVRIESADMPLGVGSRVVITVRGPLGKRIRWVALYAEFRPPAAVVFGEEARWTDVQEEGPFARWEHRHEFEAVDSKTTRVVDRVTYRLPGGPIGWAADWGFVRWKVRRMFAHRRRALGEIFSHGVPE